MTRIIFTLILLISVCNSTIGQNSIPALTKAEEHTLSKDNKFSTLLLKTNLLADVGTILNLGAEVNINERFSLDLPVYYSPYNLSKSRKMRVFLVQPEIKYWMDATPFDGHYFGANISTGWYNIALNSNRRYQDNKMLMGIGVSYGYYVPLLESKWLFGYHVGLGYSHFSYDKFRNKGAKEKLGERHFNYFGITQIGVTLAYRIKLK